MYASLYLPKILTALFGGLFIALGVYTFNNAVLFDLLFLSILLFSAFVCRKDVNVLGVVLIITMIRMMTEAGWYFNENVDEVLTKMLFYGISLAIYLKVKFDKLSHLLLFSLIASVSAEFYWALKDIESSTIHLFTLLLALSLLARYLLFVRVFYSDSLVGKQAHSINLDWQIYKLNAVIAVAQTLMISEYLLRHLFDLQNLMYVYMSYQFAVGIINFYTIWVIFYESYHLLLKRIIKA